MEDDSMRDTMEDREQKGMTGAEAVAALSEGRAVRVIIKAPGMEPFNTFRYRDGRIQRRTDGRWDSVLVPVTTFLRDDG